jgi:hypothetical protein
MHAPPQTVQEAELAELQRCSSFVCLPSNNRSFAVQRADKCLSVSFIASNA